MMMNLMTQLGCVGTPLYVTFAKVLSQDSLLE